MVTLVDAELELVLERDGQDPVRAHMTGRANHFVLEVSDPGIFAEAGDADGIRALVQELAARGMVVRVEHEETRLVSLGAVTAPWWQRRATGSRRIRLGSLRGAWTSARARARDTEPVLPGPGLLPPPTLWPPIPTFARGRRRHPTTTHDPAHGGEARLVLFREDVWAGERQPIFWLQDGATVGSRPGCDVELPGLEPLHAILHHDGADEWVVEAVAGITRVHGQAVTRQLLRTGARVQVGGHELIYRREEFADHGRPHGGRQGGEAGTQLPQAPRDAPSLGTGEWSGEAG